MVNLLLCLLTIQETTKRRREDAIVKLPQTKKAWRYEPKVSWSQPRKYRVEKKKMSIMSYFQTIFSVEKAYKANWTYDIRFICCIQSTRHWKWRPWQGKEYTQRKLKDSISRTPCQSFFYSIVPPGSRDECVSSYETSLFPALSWAGKQNCDVLQKKMSEDWGSVEKVPPLVLFLSPFFSTSRVPFVTSLRAESLEPANTKPHKNIRS